MSSGAMSTTRLTDRLRDLQRLLSLLLGDHQQLIDVLQRKVLAMRQSDVARIYDCTHAEEKLVKDIGEHEAMRKQLMSHMAVELGVNERAARALTLSQIGQKLGDHRSIGLLTTGKQLAAVMAEIAKVNKTIATFASQMLGHYRTIFRDITHSVQESTVYEQRGRKNDDLRAQMVDAQA